MFLGNIPYKLVYGSAANTNQWVIQVLLSSFSQEPQTVDSVDPRVQKMWVRVPRKYLSFSVILLMKVKESSI